MLNITDHSFISSIIKCIYIITYVEKCRELPKSVNTTLGSRIIYEEIIVIYSNNNKSNYGDNYQLQDWRLDDAADPAL